MTSCWHFPHQTLESNCFLLSSGMVAHSLAAGAVNLGMDSDIIYGYRRAFRILKPVMQSRVSDLPSLCLDVVNIFVRVFAVKSNIYNVLYNYSKIMTYVYSHYLV